MIYYKIEGNKVIASFDCTKSELYQFAVWREMLINEFKNRFNINDSNDFDITTTITDILLKIHNFTGVARCADKDEFKLEFGKELAKARLLQKYHKILTRLFMIYKGRLDNYYDCIISHISKHNNYTDMLKSTKEGKWCQRIMGWQ